MTNLHPFLPRHILADPLILVSTSAYWLVSGYILTMYWVVGWSSSTTTQYGPQQVSNSSLTPVVMLVAMWSGALPLIGGGVVGVAGGDQDGVACLLINCHSIRVAGWPFGSSLGSCCCSCSSSCPIWINRIRINRIWINSIWINRIWIKRIPNRSIWIKIWLDYFTKTK